MKLENYELHLPSYSIGDSIYRNIGPVCSSYGKTVLIIGGQKALRAAEGKIRAAVAQTGLEIIGAELFGDDCTYRNVERLRALPLYRQADMVFAVGGGRAVDTCKVYCDQEDKPIFTFPTIASNCAAVTSLSVMYREDDSLAGYYFLKKPPLHCFINTRIIAEAPEDLLWAGIGDALSKGYEVQLAARDRNLFHTVAMGVALSHCCTDPLVEYGAAALAACREGRPSYELQEVALDIIISTGLVSNLTTGPNCEYYYNSSIAHCIYNGSTVIPSVVHNHRHGAIVSFGVLCLLTYDGQYGERDRIMAFNHSIGLPVTMAEIGLREEDLPALAQKSSTVTEWTCTPYAMDQKTLMEKILECDTAGKTFLKKFQKTLD